MPCRLKAPVFILLIAMGLGLTQCTIKSPVDLNRIQIDSLVTADIETRPVDALLGQDAADDMAIWVHPDDPAGSLVIGTDKTSGLCVYNLQGELIHFYPVGRANNVDLRYGFPFADNQSADIIGCSERDNNEIILFRIDPEDGSLTEISGHRLVTEMDEIYGFCMYKSRQTGLFYALVNDKDGTIDQWELSPFEDSEITGTIARTLKVLSQPEGMVADDELGFLYVGEEDKGIWKFKAEPQEPDEPVFIQESDTSNRRIAYDIEGLTIYFSSNNQGYLIASSQGNNSYAIFEREGQNKYLGSFKIIDDGIDGTFDTDGIDVCNLNLGEPFESGLFIAQDGSNSDEDTYYPQNFKFVSWSKIAHLFDPPLIMDDDYFYFDRN